MISPSFKFAINSQGCNKNWDNKILSSQFQDVEGTIQDTIAHVKQGHALCAGLLDGRWRCKSNFAGSQWVLVDIDNSGLQKDENGNLVKDVAGKAIKIYSHQLTIDEAIEHPFIRQYCALIYTTASHTVEHHKFRLVFRLPEFLSDIDQYEAIVRLLLDQLPHDPACKDGVRVFYGNTAAEFPFVNGEAYLPIEWTEQAEIKAQQEREERAKREKLLTIRREEFQQQAQEEGWDVDRLIEQALSFIPPRMPGSNNYEECLKTLQALHSHYGAAEAEAIAERWSPSIKGTTWNIQQKLKSFKRSGTTIGSLFHIAKQYGFRFPQRPTAIYRPPSPAPDPVEYDKYVRQEQEQAQIVAAQAWEDFVQKLKRLHRRALPWKGFGTPPRTDTSQSSSEQPTPDLVPPLTSAIVLYDAKFAARRWVQWITPATVPTVEAWEQMGRPVFVYAPIDRLAIVTSLVDYGYPTVLMTDTTGSGKSHFAGQFLQQHQARERDRQQRTEAENGGTLPQDYTIAPAIYTAHDYRNPSTESLEAIPEAITGGALVLDRTKSTPSGNPYRKRAAKGQTPDIEALCIEDENIQALRAKGLDAPRGKNSAFCQNCTQLQGCSYLVQQAEQKQQTTLRTHLNKFSPSPGSIVLIDEAGRAIQGTRQITTTWADVETEISRIARLNPQLYQRLQPLLERLSQSLNRAIEEKGYHGLTHIELLKFLPTAAEITPQLWAAVFDDWLAVDDPWRFVDAIERLRSIIQPHLQNTLVGATTPEAKSQIIEELFTAGVIPKLLNIILGADRSVLTITGDRQIIITQRSYRQAKAIARTRTAVLLDGTPDQRDLARKLSIKAEQICTIKAVSLPFTSLTIKRIRGLGRVGQQRKADSPQCLMPRILKTVEAIVRAAPDPQRVGLLDLKRFTDCYAPISQSLLIGHHFADNRNSNRFRECLTMISVPLAAQHLGLLLAEWCVQTGQTFTLAEAPAPFWAWATRKTTQELLQDIGRTRAQHRPNEAITHWVLTEISDDQWQQVQAYFPGCRAEEVDIYDLCPEAASRSTQTTARRIVEAVWQSVRQGESITIKTVATQLELDKSRISQVAKLIAGGFRALRSSLVWLINAFNNQIQLSTLPADHQWLAESYLPELARDVAERDRPPIEVFEDFQIAIQDMTEAEVAQVLTITSLPTLTRLLGSFLSLLPPNHLSAIQQACELEAIFQGRSQLGLRFSSE